MSAVAEHFREQADHCLLVGSPFTARVLEIVLDLLEKDLPITRAIRDWPTDPRPDALSLRIAGGLHGLVLQETAPGLAAAYPGGARFGEDAYLVSAIAEALDDHGAALAQILTGPPQTNEVGRSGVLAGGFYSIAAATGKPLALLEIGASGGLNLLWDQYSYVLGGETRGAAGGRPCLAPTWQGPPPPGGPAEVVLRAGCDHLPVNLHDRAGQLRLRSYIWADQVERLNRLDAAMAVVAASDLVVERSDAVGWLAEKLHRRPDNAVTVLFHSVFWQYLRAQTKAALQEMIERAGADASDQAPFAWLRMEADAAAKAAELRLTLWPGGEDRLLARGDFHGHWVEWLEGGPDPAT